MRQHSEQRGQQPPTVGGDAVSDDRILDAEEVANIAALPFLDGDDEPITDVADLATSHEALREQLRATQTWDGVMAFLDREYPPDVFDGSSGDPGPRIVVLMRELRATQTERDELRHGYDVLHGWWQEAVQAKSAAEGRVETLTRLLERAEAFIPDRAQVLQVEVRAVLGGSEHER